MKTADQRLQEIQDRAEKRAERATAEAQRIAEVTDLGAVPGACGGEIEPAPGRGPVATFLPLQLLPQGADGWTMAPNGHKGRLGLRRADAFDIAADQVRRRDKAAAPPFTPSEIAMGRTYRDLVERYAAGAIKCSDVEGQVSSGTGRDFMDTYIAIGEEIAALRRWIGEGAALELRRMRPSKSGGPARRMILKRTLVDDFCLRDQPITAIMKAHGWSNDKGTRARVTLALRASLGDMAARGRHSRIVTLNKGG